MGGCQIYGPLFGSSKYSVPHYTKDPKRDHNFDNYPCPALPQHLKKQEGQDESSFLHVPASCSRFHYNSITLYCLYPKEAWEQTRSCMYSIRVSAIGQDLSQGLSPKAAASLLPWLPF